MKLHPFFKGVLFIWLMAAIVASLVGCKELIEYVYRISNHNEWLTVSTMVAITSIYVGIINWYLKNEVDRVR